MAQEPNDGGPFVLPDEGCNLEAVERGLLWQALQRTKQNQTRAANLLGITRYALRYRMAKYGFGPAPTEPEPGRYTTEGGDRDERLRTTD